MTNTMVHVQQVKQKVFMQLGHDVLIHSHTYVLIHSHTYVCLRQAFACLQLSKQRHILLNQHCCRFTLAIAQAVL